MNEIPVRGRLRRFAVLVVLVALLVQVTLAVVATETAGADICINCGGGGGGGGTTWTSTLTVTPPARGTVYGRVSGSATNVIACSAAGGTCSTTDSQVDYVRPTDGWLTYAFTYSAPAGYVISWGGACSGTGACSVVNDQPDTSLTAVSYDVQAPAVSVNAPARVGPNTTLSASATDNDSVARYEWDLCHADGTQCAHFATGPTATISGFASGDYQVRVRAYDPSGNVGTAAAQISYVSGVLMTWQTLPSYTESPSFWFHSDDEAHVPYDNTHRRCRAFPTGGSPGDWGSCTTWTSYAPHLADGNWTLQAEEIDDLGLIGTTFDTTTVDATAPSVAYTDGPTEGGTVSTPTVQFGFAASDANLTSVTCTLDAQQPVACTSPYTLDGYADGQHTLTITATDVLGHQTSAVRHFAVLVATTLTPGASTLTIAYGQRMTLGATIAPASGTGTVAFTAANGRTLCSAALDAGTASCTARAWWLHPGTHAVTARYSGSYASSSAQLSLVVRKAATAVHVKAPARVRRHHTMTVTASDLPWRATGRVTVSVPGHRLCSARVRRGSASCSFTVSLSLGRHRLVVRYGGDADYRASSARVSVRVTR